jgi:hypothetical protein
MTDDPKADCERLMNDRLPFAIQMLERHGEFYPFGGALKTDGTTVHVGAFDGDEHPPSADVIAWLTRGFVDGAREEIYRATALIYDVKTTIPSTGARSDAIAVSLDHRSGYSVVVMFPYENVAGRVIVGIPFAQKGSGAVFGKL